MVYAILACCVEENYRHNIRRTFNNIKLNFEVQRLINIYKNDKINKRSTWHPHCADEYMMIYHPGETRKRIWLRDGGECAKCGKIQPRKSRFSNDMDIGGK